MNHDCATHIVLRTRLTVPYAQQTDARAASICARLCWRRFSCARSPRQCTIRAESLILMKNACGAAALGENARKPPRYLQLYLVDI